MKRLFPALILAAFAGMCFTSCTLHNEYKEITIHRPQVSDTTQIEPWQPVEPEYPNIGK